MMRKDSTANSIPNLLLELVMFIWILEGDKIDLVTTPNLIRWNPVGLCLMCRPMVWEVLQRHGAGAETARRRMASGMRQLAARQGWLPCPPGLAGLTLWVKT
jgi:hypothetical protein